MIKNYLEKLHLSQTDLAELLEVTTRTVSLWATEQREIPGPVKAYLRLLISVSPEDRQRELSRLRKGEDKMTEGMYGVHFKTQEDHGVAILIFESEQIYGADEGGVRYDGSYFYDPQKDLFDAKIKITIPPNVDTVMGICNPYEWSFDVEVSIPAKATNHEVSVDVVGHQVSAIISYLRPLPIKQAA